MKNMLFAAIIMLVITFSSCKDNSTTPENNNNTGSYKYIFYTKVFENPDNAQIYRIDAEGNDVMFRDSAMVLGVAGGNLYFFDFKQSQSKKANLYVASAEGMEIVKLGQWNIKEIVHAQLSPDGSKILYYSPYHPGMEIHCSNTDGSNDVIIHEMPDYTIDDPFAFAGFAPDMKSIGILDAGVDGDGELDYYSCNIDGTGKQKILSFKGYTHMRGGWSPDGKRLAYLQVDDDSKEYLLSEINLATKASKRILNQNLIGIKLTWSPDGSKIAFYSDPGKFYIVNSDGSGLVQVTNIESKMNNMTGYYPTWSKDGKQILFQTSKNEEGGDLIWGDLKLYNTQTKELKTLVAEEIVWNAFFL